MANVGPDCGTNMHDADNGTCQDCGRQVETCSWCTDEVLDSTLAGTNEGRLCPTCAREYRGALRRDIIGAVG